MYIILRIPTMTILLYLSPLFDLVLFGTAPRNDQGLLFAIHLRDSVVLRDHMRCQELNPDWLHASQAPYPLYFFFPDPISSLDL